MDEWQFDEGGVARGKLHSSLCSASPLSPSPLAALSSLVRSFAPRYSSSNYLKKDILFTFGPFSYSVCPAGKFYLSDQTGSRSAQHGNSVPSLSRKALFNKYKKAWQWPQEKERVRKKEALLGGRVNQFAPWPKSRQRDLVLEEKMGFGEHNVYSLTLTWIAQVLTQWVRLHVSVKNPLWLTNKSVVSVVLSKTSWESIYESLQ